MNGLMIGFTTGTSIVTSRFFGAKEEKGVKRSVFCSFLLAVSMSVIITAVLVLSMPTILRLMNTDKEFYKEAYNYIIVISWGLILMTLYKLFESMLRAVGIAKMSLVFAIVSFFANVLLDILFIAAFGMGTEGAALATILSFAICAALCLLYIIKKAPALHIKRSDMRVSWEIIRSQLKMALPMSLQQSVKALGSTLVQSSYNLLGTVPVAAYSVAGKLEHITTDAYTALGSTVSTFCGTNAGAKKSDRIKAGIKATLIIGVIYTLASGVLLLIFGKMLTPLFISENVAESKRYVATFLYCVVPFFVFLCTLVVVRYAVQGLGFSGIALTAGFIELILRVVMSYFGGNARSFVITSLSYPVSWFGAACFLVIIYFVRVRKKIV